MGHRYRTVEKLSFTDAAYIAGLIDGEGTIALSRKHANENRQLAISISSTERSLVEFVLVRTGVGKVTNKRRSRDHHRASFAYAVYNRHALEILRQIHPFLRSYKRIRSEFALRHYVRLTPRNGKYSPADKKERNEFEAAFMAIKPPIDDYMLRESSSIYSDVVNAFARHEPQSSPMRRNLNPAPLPPRRVTIQFLYPEITRAQKPWWLIVDKESRYGTVDLCMKDPTITSIKAL